MEPAESTCARTQKTELMTLLKKQWLAELLRSQDSYEKLF